jgi:hypothetical protein
VERGGHKMCMKKARKELEWARRHSRGRMDRCQKQVHHHSQQGTRQMADGDLGPRAEQPGPYSGAQSMGVVMP